MLLRALTSILVHMSSDGDVINIDGGRGVEEDRPVQSRVVEEVKVCILDKVTLGVPRVGGQWPSGPCLEFFSLTPAKASPPCRKTTGRLGLGWGVGRGVAHLEVSVL